MVVFDTATLLLSFFPSAGPPIDPRTGHALTQAQARVDHLIEKLSNSGEVVLVPTPVLTELLCRADDQKDRIMRDLNKGNRFRIGAFDQRAAFELALMLEDWRIAGKPRDPNETAAKVKLDRQIVAIAKVNGAHTIYTDDDGLMKFAQKNDLEVVLTWDLPLPPPAPPKVQPRHDDGTQGQLGLGPTES